MNRRGPSLNFQRGVSQTSSGSAAAATMTNGHAESGHSKKKTAKARQGADYLMGQGQTPGASSKKRLAHSKPSNNGISPGTNLEITSGNLAGGMSVTDIELTMSGEEISSQKNSPRLANQVEGGARAASTLGGAEDVSRNAEKLSLKSLPEKCEKEMCDSCLWHCSVLKWPHRVQWRAQTVRVELTRRKGCNWPGFYHKLKQHKDTDEIYVLVTKIARDGIASGSGLCVGDLILSVNSIPLQQDTMPRIDFEESDTLIFQIQHPEALSPELAGCIERQFSSGSSSIIPPEVKGRLQQPQSPSPSPTNGFTNYLSQNNENIPLSPLTKTTSGNCQPLPQTTIFVSGNSAIEFVKCLVGDRITSFVELNPCASCFGVSLKLSTSSTFPSNSSVTVDNWESFSYLFNGNKVKALDNPSSPLLSCINVRLVVVEDDNFFLNCCPWMFSASSVFILTFDTNRLLSSSATEMSRLTKIARAVRTGMANNRRVHDSTVGGGGGTAAASFQQAFSLPLPGAMSTATSYPPLMMVGVETSQASHNLEEIRALFYTSLGEALPRPDIISARQGGQSCPEMIRLRQQIFLVLSGCGGSTKTDSSSPNAPTPSTSALQFGSWNSASPVLLASSAVTYDSMPRIGLPTAVALDIISGHQSLTISQGELLRILSNSPVFEDCSAAGCATAMVSPPRFVNGRSDMSRQSSHSQESVFAQVVEDLRNTRNIILLDSLNIGCRLEGDKEFVLPTILFDKLLRLAQRAGLGGLDGLSEAQQNTLRTLNVRGIVSRPELAELLSIVSSHPDKLLLCLDDQHITFPVRTGQHCQQQEADSGFDDGLSVLFPYFKEDLPFDPSSLDGFEEYWTIQFSEEVPLTSFYCILSELSIRWPMGLDLSMHSQLVAHVAQAAPQGGPPLMLGDQNQQPPGGATLYYICFQQVVNQMQAFKRRSGASGHGCIPPSKESQMTENLAVTNVIAIASKHVSVTTKIWQLQRSAASPPVTLPVLPRYSGEVQVDLPEEPEEDEGNAVAVLPPPTAESEAHMQMMETRVAELRFVTIELRELYSYLSITYDWQELGGHLGLSTQDIRVQQSMLELRPNVPPGQQFLENVMAEPDFTLRVLLQGLLKMSKKKKYKELAKNLWTAALLNNSHFYLNLRRNAEI